ncbi:MAG: hypothetical protein ACI9XJ_000694, partial [Marivirga sp.]
QSGCKDKHFNSSFPKLIGKKMRKFLVGFKSAN